MRCRQVTEPIVMTYRDLASTYSCMIHDTRDYGDRQMKESSVVQRIIVYSERRFSRGKERQMEIRLLAHLSSRIGDTELVLRLLRS